MMQDNGNGGRGKFSPKWLFAVTNIFSLACLVWVLHDLDLAGLADDLANMHWGWVTVAVAADILVYVWQGYRWSLLLNPVTPVPLWRSVRAIYVGLFANEVLPLRSGEVIRCYLQGRWSGLPFSVVLSSALIERIFDGIWLMFMLVVSLRFVKLPKFLVDGSMVLGAVIAVAAIILGIVMFHKHHAHAAVASSRWARKLQVLVDDLHAIGNSPSFYLAAAVSLPYLLLQVVPIYALLQGFDIDLSVGAACVVLLILRLGTVLPQAPGNLGTFQAITALALSLFGVEMAVAKRFSIILWGVITLPLLVIGFIALAVTGMRIGELRRHAQAGLAPQPDTSSAD